MPPVCNKLLLLQHVTGDTELVVASIQCPCRQLSHVWIICQGLGSKPPSIACELGRFLGPPPCKGLSSDSKPGTMPFGLQSLALSAATPPANRPDGVVLASPNLLCSTTLYPEPTNHTQESLSQQEDP